MPQSHKKRTSSRRGPSSKRSALSERQGSRVVHYSNVKDFGFPDRYACKLKYTQTNTLTGTGSTGQQVFRMNSLFDPDLTGTGAQPECFDQLAAVYGKYLVTMCKYDVSFTNLNSTAANVVVCASDATLSGSTFDSICENKRAKMTSLSVNSGGKATARIKGSVKMSDLHGQPNLDSDSTQYSPVSSNPSDATFLTLEAADFTGATTISVGVRTKLTFFCVFKEFNIASDSFFKSLNEARKTGSSVSITPVSSDEVQKSVVEAQRLTEINSALASLNECVQTPKTTLHDQRINKLRAEFSNLGVVNKKL
jgi:hypothetical protein